MSDLLQLQRKAERQRIVGYEPDFELDLDEIDRLAAWSADGATGADVARAVAASRRDLRDLAALLSPAGTAVLEMVARAAHELTVKRFGRTMHMFAPAYLSNECVSECTYCGFQVHNRDIVRRTLDERQLRGEVRYLSHLGFRHVLLVAGEHPKHVSADYITSCVQTAAAEVPTVSLEVQAWDVATYRRFVEAGCEGLVLYQECYDPRRYGDFHLKGNKRFYPWRIGAADRAAEAGMRRVGLGALVGLNPDWRWEVLALAAHARYLMRRWWRTEVTVALPRLEPAAGFQTPPQVMTDAEFAQATSALRLVLPDAGIVLSTREPVRLRDGLVRLGVTHLSAGSRTEPGGYEEPGAAEEQFSVSDRRSPEEVAAMLRAAGYDPVWKGSSPALRRGSPPERL
ncbi:MAG TPA: 2-iminoacetate synthase ThiH [Actinomycetota bacterium]|nr:2-iminoacetate synthase ThiH [Actinomycetota bacterium]